MPLIGELLLNLMKLQLLALTKERLGFVAKSINLSSYFALISGLILFLCINSQLKYITLAKSGLF